MLIHIKMNDREKLQILMEACLQVCSGASETDPELDPTCSFGNYECANILRQAMKRIEE
jgi:hypothetical protein